MVSVVLIAQSCSSATRRSGQVELFVADYTDEFDRPMSPDAMRAEGARLVPAYMYRDRPRPLTARVDPDFGDPVRYNDDVVTIQVLSGYLDHLPWTLSESLTGRVDIILFAEVWENAAESYGSPSLNRIVYVAQDQEVPGRLNFLGNLAYGPTFYKGHPMKVKFTLMLLQKKTNEKTEKVGTAVGAVANFVSAASVATPFAGLASQAVSVVREVMRNQPDVVAFDFEATLLSDMPEGLLRTVLDTGAADRPFNDARNAVVSGIGEMNDATVTLLKSEELTASVKKWKESWVQIQEIAKTKPDVVVQIFGSDVSPNALWSTAYQALRKRDLEGKLKVDRKLDEIDAADHKDAQELAAAKKIVTDLDKSIEIMNEHVQKLRKKGVTDQLRVKKDATEQESVELRKDVMAIAEQTQAVTKALRDGASASPRISLPSAPPEIGIDPQADEINVKLSEMQASIDVTAAAKSKVEKEVTKLADAIAQDGRERQAQRDLFTAYRNVVQVANGIETQSDDASPPPGSAESKPESKQIDKLPRSNKLRPMDNAWNQTMSWLDYGVYSLIETQEKQTVHDGEGLSSARRLYDLSFQNAYRLRGGWLACAETGPVINLPALKDDPDENVKRAADEYVQAAQRLDTAKARATASKRAVDNHERLCLAYGSSHVGKNGTPEQSRQLDLKQAWNEAQAESLRMQQDVVEAQREADEFEGELRALLRARDRDTGKLGPDIGMRRKTLVPADRLNTNYLVFAITPGQHEEDDQVLADAARLDSELRAKLMSDTKSVGDIAKAAESAAQEVAYSLMNRKLAIVSKAAAREAANEENDAAKRLEAFERKLKVQVDLIRQGLEDRGVSKELKDRLNSSAQIITDQWKDRLSALKP